MKKIILTSAMILSAVSIAMSSNRHTDVNIKIIATTDVHGSFFPYDFIEGRPLKGSLARIASYVTRARAQQPDGVVLLDNGDILQGQPINYYYNFLSADSENIAAQCLNFMRYDAYTCGNHDIEPGAPCYTKFFRALKCPVLGANVIDTITDKPYLRPYTIVERQGIRIAIIGLITPAIPHWLMPEKWTGLRFDDMMSTARQWVSHVKTYEQPDIVVGLFHSGRSGGISQPDCRENMCEEIARSVPGFDIILYGHDHRPVCETIQSDGGHNVLMVNAGNAARQVAEVTIFSAPDGTLQKKARLADICNEQPDSVYMKHFQTQINEVQQWAQRKIGTIDTTITTRDCFFGPSAFTDLIHNLQLHITGADISIAAPLTFNATLHKGDITVADMFKLYKYENTLCVVSMTGREIRQHLEMSYAQWAATMTSPHDHLMLLNDERSSHERAVFKHMYFDFDSAAGIDYIVDVRQPAGSRIKIQQMTDGTPFDEEKTYRVAMNSYRANGGGQLLTQGAGIPKAELPKRILWQSELDQRYYLMKEIERRQHIAPQPNSNWHFHPKQWTDAAALHDRKIIFGE